MAAPYPGPIPIYNNPPIHPEYFKPRRFTISNIQLGETTIVTTTLDMDFVLGQEIRLLIPHDFGCVQLNQMLGFVISIPSPTQVEVDINSNFGVNQYIASMATTPAQIIPVGDINTGFISRNGTNTRKVFIPGSFKNISPL